MTHKKGQLHCQSCGSTDAENVGHDALRRGEGYTACCNELAVTSTREVHSWATGRYTTEATACDPTRCYHD